MTILGFNDTPELKRKREIENIEDLLARGYGRTNKPISRQRRQRLEKRLQELIEKAILDQPGPSNTCDGCTKAIECHEGGYHPRIIESRQDLSSFCINKQI